MLNDERSDSSAEEIEPLPVSNETAMEETRVIGNVHVIASTDMDDVNETTQQSDDDGILIVPPADGSTRHEEQQHDEASSLALSVPGTESIATDIASLSQGGEYLLVQSTSTLPKAPPRQEEIPNEAGEDESSSHEHVAASDHPNASQNPQQQNTAAGRSIIPRVSLIPLLLACIMLFVSLGMNWSYRRRLAYLQVSSELLQEEVGVLKEEKKKWNEQRRLKDEFQGFGEGDDPEKGFVVMDNCWAHVKLGGCAEKEASRWKESFAEWFKSTTREKAGESSWQSPESWGDMLQSVVDDVEDGAAQVHDTLKKGGQRLMQAFRELEAEVAMSSAAEKDKLMEGFQEFMDSWSKPPTREATSEQKNKSWSDKVNEFVKKHVAAVDGTPAKAPPSSPPSLLPMKWSPQLKQAAPVLVGGIAATTLASVLVGGGSDEQKQDG